MPVSPATARTRPGRSPCRKWIGEMLIETRSGADQRAASAQASRSTHSLSGAMLPVRSASGMNCAGGISPRSGCVQRRSASKPRTREVAACRRRADRPARTAAARSRHEDRPRESAPPGGRLPWPARTGATCFARSSWHRKARGRHGGAGSRSRQRRRPARCRSRPKSRPDGRRRPSATVRRAPPRQARWPMRAAAPAAG